MPSTRRTRVSLALLGLAVACLNTPSSSSASEPALAKAGQKVTWSGDLTLPDPAGCGDVASHGCLQHDLVVDAPRGSWVTVSIDGATYLKVEAAGQYVASNGQSLNTRESPSNRFTVTFQQLRSGRMTYKVGVSTTFASPVTPVPFRVDATLAGRAFDSAGECFVKDSGVSALLAPDDGKDLDLNLRLVSDPKDATVAHTAAKGLVEIYQRIGVRVHVTFDQFHLSTVDPGSGYPYDQVKAHYHGVRPRGIDVVHVIDDDFNGGFADCIGGIAYKDKGFSTSNAHYNLQGITDVSTVPTALLLAHEIGHELGGQHQMVSCVEATPQLVTKPASDGSVGPCTQMGPAALQDSETWSTLERASIRSVVRMYAGKNR